jgi:hypothetical protein
MTEPEQTREIILAQERQPLALPDHASALAQLKRVREFQATVRELFVVNHDYGVIPGTGNKPTLLKPGAEKLTKLLGLADTYDFVDRTEDFEHDFFNYTVRCRLVSMATGQIVAEGLGNCNSHESKYRWRWAWPRDLSEPEKVGLKTRTLKGGGVQYRVENDDVASLVNTIIKMAKKRAQVDAALSAGRLSEVFTQDLEDMTPTDESADGPAPTPTPAAVQRPSPARAAPPAGPQTSAPGGQTTEAQRSALSSMIGRLGREVVVPERFEDAARLISELNEEINRGKGDVIEGEARELPADIQVDAIPFDGDEREDAKSATAPSAPGNGALVCDACGDALTETKFRDGTAWTPAQLAAYGRKKHGRVLCMSDYKAANDALKASTVGSAT